MSSNPLSDAGNDPLAVTPKTLQQTLKENQELRTDNQKLRETEQRMNARLSALLEENEELRKERDSYKEELVEAKEQHEAELLGVTEEMAAAARFSDNEWREHCNRVEAQCARLQRAVDACMPAILEYLPHAEAAARRELLDEEGKQRRDLQGRQWEASSEEVHTREAARAEAVFAARGLSMSDLRRTHLGKGPANERSSYAAGEGLYNLFLALRPGGPVDRFVMRGLLRGETNVTHVYYNTQGQRDTWSNVDFTIPAADAYELAACVLCHLPALQELAFRYLPPLSTRSLDWVSNLPQCMKRLSFWYTAYTVADLRQLHRRRGSRTFRVDACGGSCTDWGEFAGVGDDDTKMNRLNEELGGMMEL